MFGVSASQIERFFKFGHETVLRSSQGIIEVYLSPVMINTFFRVNSLIFSYPSV